jgi:hypothetical protein
MEYRIDFGGEPQDVTITLSGEADVATIARCERELTSDERYRTGLAILCDCTQLKTWGLVHEAVIEAAARPVSRRDFERPPRALAFVAADEKGASDLRLWRAHLGGSKSRRRIFTSREDALDWLREKRDQPVNAH